MSKSLSCHAFRHYWKMIQTKLTRSYLIDIAEFLFYFCFQKIIRLNYDNIYKITSGLHTYFPCTLVFLIRISGSQTLQWKKFIDIFSCDSSSMRSNVRRSVGRSVGRSVRQQRVSKFNRMIKQCIENNA